MTGFRSDEDLNELAFASDQESFLQLFEKPTQIYRFLMYRNKISPIFLQRTLSYMVNRKRPKRRVVRIDELLPQMELRMENMERFKWDFLNLTFHGYQSKEPVEEEEIEVEVNLLHINHKKRKDSSSVITTTNVGKVTVRHNSTENDKVGNLLAIHNSKFNVGNGCCNKSTILQFKVLRHIAESDISPPKKKFKKSKEDFTLSKKPLHSCNMQLGMEKKKTLQAELLIFSRKNNCCLTGGVYELELQEDAFSSRSSENAVWQTVSGDKNDINHIGNPKLVFMLEWCKDVDGNSKVNSQNVFSGSETVETFRDHSWNKEVKCDFPPMNIKKQKVFYQFLSSNNTRQQTLAKESKCCPWCLVDCRILSSLLCHLKYCHGRFNFVYVDNQNGGRIDVSLNELYDGSYVGNPHDMHRNVGRAFSRSGPMRRMNVTELLVCKSKSSGTRKTVEIENENNKARPVVHGHTRLYYRTMTCQPIDPKNMEVDSENENDPLWLRLKTQQMIDEFMDVNDGEKEIMKLWNMHVMHVNYIGDCQMLEACREFVRLYGRSIPKKNLMKNMMLHFANLFDFGLLSPKELCLVISQLLKIQHST